MFGGLVEIRLAGVGDGAALSDFYTRNADHLRRWEPTRSGAYHTVPVWERRLQAWQAEFQEGRSVHFLGILPDASRVIAVCSLTNIIRGPFQACNMGYAVDRHCEGRGVMKTLCGHVVAYAFDVLKLNRVMANYMPDNHRSAVLLRSLNFTIEGVAKRYLLINGCWEDHVLTARINTKKA
ncbi:GNAT family N-acetyltransferase [Microbulbifer spongiae]|uniref:GNAT family N-acetyltransferase n=1 Tax=Microbulbifer spongiae TaxID=2944933 RepID=A0ABY9EGH0_9GAMM|nr:GNAT family N-acetyltransferase [Microbulbifer sp. MI-G]WKD51198.1 GNAT family N-acetyltransferase [Microbulbifer sp. MI-G]